MRIAKSVFSTGLIIGIFLFGSSVHSAPQAKTPEEFFGFKPGTDRKLIDYQQLISYLTHLDSVSDRITIRKVGKSPLGKDMYVTFLSLANNIARLSSLKEINRRLALEPMLSQSEKKKLIQEGRVFVMATLSMHSNEVAPSQMLPLYAYQLVKTNDPDVLKQMQNVVWMIVPCHNPDGMDMIVNHYRKYIGTKYEGCSMPGVYHKYVGHDNNRDFVTLTQSDTKVISRLFSTDWFPQVLVQKHQMGSTGPRYFVPPYHDPITENCDHGLIEWCSVFGSNLLKDFGKAELKGVSTHYLFDKYWPGSTETSMWKNIISLLTEAAGAKLAKPVFIEPNELSVRGKGLSEYKRSVNMPEPWPGGWWRLSDIVQYELVSMQSFLKTASKYKEEILSFRNDLCRKEVQRGKTEPPYYYILPLDQRDRSELVRVVRLLQEHGVEVYRLNTQTKAENKLYMAGDIVIPLSQPYRAFVKEVLEHQVYPLRHYTPGGKEILPYDVTSWSIPLHAGVTGFEIKTRSESLESKWSKIVKEYIHPEKRNEMPKKVWALGYRVEDNASYKAAFRALAGSVKVGRLTKPLKLGSKKLSPGGFLLEYSSKKKRVLKNIYLDTNIEPIWLYDQIEVQKTPLRLPRIGLVETYYFDKDAGWTRYVFDQYHIPFKVLHPEDLKKIDLYKEFDVIVIPDTDKDLLYKGKLAQKKQYHPTDYPPKYRKGMGKKGLAKLMAFVDAGGRVISWARSTRLFMGDLQLVASKKPRPEKTFRLPIRDLYPKLKKKGYYVSGSLLRVNLLANHPLTLGMSGETGVFSKGKPVFQTSVPLLDMDRRVIASFPEKDILISGYIKEQEQLFSKPAMVWLKKGKGQLILFGFNPQYRGSTAVTYKLLFNALLIGGLIP